MKRYDYVYRSALTDDDLKHIFHTICDAERFDVTFHYGDVECSEEGFIRFARNPYNHLWMLIANGIPSGIVWITDLEPWGVGQMHFCMFGAVPNITELRMCRYFVADLFETKDDDGEYILNAMMCITPKANEKAIRFVQKAGCRYCGELPYGTFNKDTGKPETAVMSVLSRDTIDPKWRVIDG